MSIVEELNKIILKKDKDINIIISRMADIELNINEISLVINLLPLIVCNYTFIFEFEDNKKIIRSSQYEGLIWQVGESFRNIIKKNKKLHKNRILFDKIEEVARNISYGKGRESFVMLLGQYGGVEYIDALICLLDDSVVSGHAVYSLRLLKAVEAKEYVKPLLKSNITWVRNEAKKYFHKIEKK